MTSTLVDTNVLVDILGGPGLGAWSQFALVRCALEGELVINPIIWAELSASYGSEEDLEAAFSHLPVGRLELPFEAGFPAGQAHAAYRKAGGLREKTLPDFLIGGHASVGGLRLLTRDANRFRHHFPNVILLTPETLPMPDTHP